MISPSQVRCCSSVSGMWSSSCCCSLNDSDMWPLASSSAFVKFPTAASPYCACAKPSSCSLDLMASSASISREPLLRRSSSTLSPASGSSSAPCGAVARAGTRGGLLPAVAEVEVGSRAAGGDDADSDEHGAACAALGRDGALAAAGGVADGGGAIDGGLGVVPFAEVRVNRAFHDGVALGVRDLAVGGLAQQVLPRVRGDGQQHGVGAQACLVRHLSGPGIHGRWGSRTSSRRRRGRSSRGRCRAA